MKLKLLALAFILRALATAQTGGGDPLSAEGARLTIESRTVPVLVRLDTTFLGSTPLRDLPITAGTHVLRYYLSESRSWFFPPTLDTLIVEPGSSVRRLLEPSLSYRITSEPYGATVLLGDSTVGVTPCILSTADTMGIISFSRDNYRKTEAMFSASNPNVHVILSPLPGGGSPEPFESLSTESPNKQLPIYLSTAATVITGITAVYLKMKADSYYNDYQITGNPGTLSRIRTYDTAAGIALAGTEISLLTLTFILLSR